VQAADTSSVLDLDCRNLETEAIIITTDEETPFLRQLLLLLSQTDEETLFLLVFRFPCGLLENKSGSLIENKTRIGSVLLSDARKFIFNRFNPSMIIIFSISTPIVY